MFTDPTSRDTDRDHLSDGREVRGTKLKQRVHVLGGRVVKLKTVQSNPTRKDTDHDGVNDRAEVKGSKNKRHHKHRSDPRRWDTDRGGRSDGWEIRFGSDPSDVRSGPNGRL